MDTLKNMLDVLELSLSVAATCNSTSIVRAGK